MIIDVHAHYYPKDYLDFLEKCGTTSTGVARNTGADASEKELEARFALMDKAGVDLQILSVVPQIPSFEHKENSITAAKMANDLFDQLVKDHPKRFKAFCTLPLPHIEASIEEMRRCLDELGMLGVAITTTVMNKSLVESNHLDKLFSELNRRKAVVFLHPAGCCTGDHTKVLGLTWMIGAPFEDTYGIAHLVLSGVTERYPDIQFISAHLGGYMPILLQRIDNQNEYFGTGELKGKPSDLIKKFWFDTVAHGHVPALRCAAGSFGTDHLLLGTDFPYVQGDNFVKEINFIREAEFSSEEVNKILGKNAQTLFNI